MEAPPRWHILLLTLVRVVYNTLHRMVYPFLSAFARGVGVDLTTISYALTLRSAIGTVGPFAAALSDRWGRKAGMLAGAALFVLGAGVVVLWPAFPGLVLSLVLSTLGKYLFDPSLLAYLGDRIPYEKRGRTIAITEFGWSLAFILGIPAVGFLIARRGWLAPFPLFVLLGTLILVGLFFLIPNDGRREGAHSTRGGFRLVLTSLPALAGLALGLFSSGANELVNLLFGVWLEDSFGLQIAALGLASAVIGASELGAEGLVAAFVDRLGKTRAVMLGLAVNSLAAVLLPLVGRTEAGALAGLFLFYLSFEFTLVSSIPLMTEILPQARATLMACNVAALSLGRALGAFLGPRLYPLGFAAVAAGAVLFNLIALLAVRRVHRTVRN
jgi:predicted MFS family arabinose efflux permease